LLGLYPQRQNGLWMQRVKIPGGSPTAAQWGAIGRIARNFTPQTPLHLTTRQDIELHDLSAHRVPEVHAALAAAGLSTIGACGDAPRNVTVCPCGSDELLALAGSIRQGLTDIDGVYSLPRKFKVSLSCSNGCGQPWINDLGLVASRKDGRWGFAVMAGGSLGARPGTGMKLYDWLDTAKVIPLAVATVRVFAANGDRENRRCARLRHVRERIGDEALADLIAAELKVVCAQGDWPKVEFAEATAPLPVRARLTFPNGDISADQAEALGDIASADGLAVRIGSQHQVIVLAANEARLNLVLQTPALTDARSRQSVVVSCPGTRWCSRGLTDTNAMADLLRNGLGPSLPPEMTVCISGCPNGCAHSSVADIGLSGGRIADGGQSRDVYNLMVGGGMGRNGGLAKMIHAKLTPAQVLESVRQWLREQLR